MIDNVHLLGLDGEELAQLIKTVSAPMVTYDSAINILELIEQQP